MSTPVAHQAASIIDPNRTSPASLSEEKDEELADVAADAMWSVSSFKPDFPATFLRDGLTSTFWQSDGSALVGIAPGATGSVPHAVTVTFPRKTTVYDVRIYLDLAGDESYTPVKVALRVGPSELDLRELRVMDLQPELSTLNMSRWFSLPLVYHSRTEPVRGASYSVDPQPTPFTPPNLNVCRVRGRLDNVYECVRTWVVQLVVLENSGHGRDSHIRLMQVRAPLAPDLSARRGDLPASARRQQLAASEALTRLHAELSNDVDLLTGLIARRPSSDLLAAVARPSRPLPLPLPPITLPHPHPSPTPTSSRDTRLALHEAREDPPVLRELGARPSERLAPGSADAAHPTPDATHTIDFSDPFSDPFLFPYFR